MHQLSQERSVGELFGQLTQDLSLLVRQETQLAKTEIQEKISRASRDMVSLAAGGVVALIGGFAITAAVILLRGLGRLDVFPSNDTSVARNLALIGGSAPMDVGTVLEVLGPDRGMLYYHLLLARLEARGQLTPPAATTRQPARAAGA